MTMSRAFDKLRPNGVGAVPFVVSLSNHPEVSACFGVNASNLRLGTLAFGAEQDASRLSKSSKTPLPARLRTGGATSLRSPPAYSLLPADPAQKLVSQPATYDGCVSVENVQFDFQPIGRRKRFQQRLFLGKIEIEFVGYMIRKS